MQEWIIAMLVISALLIIRDMAKTIFSGMKKSAATIVYDQHPQKEKMERYATSFQRLANSFYGMPYRKDYLSNGEIEELIGEVEQNFCEKCHLHHVCWQKQYLQTQQRIYNLLRIMEEGDEEKIRRGKVELMGICVNQGKLGDELYRMISRERQNLVWSNKLIENRLAVAEQLSEMARIMQLMSRDMFEVTDVLPEFKDDLERRLKKKNIVLKSIWMLELPDGKQQYFMRLRSRGGQCIPVNEAAAQLSKECGCSMVARKDSRSLINGEFTTYSFVEDVNFKVLYGAAKITKDKESVSGDNYMCTMEDTGQFFMCLSDGMGSGLEACQESEMVVDLLEEFIDAGFTGETAAKMVNSALVLQGKNGHFSTVDICVMDLYSGMGHFLKAGAATTFIKRNNWVEAISSTSLGLGLVQQIDFETTTKKLYDGDFLIMVTDGVLDALPLDRQEEVMKEIILQTRGNAPKELGRGILERVLGYSEYRAVDDMTVLVAGIWKK